MSKVTPITPRILGYIGGLLDIKGNAYAPKDGTLVVYINGVKDTQMQKDLVRWIGGGAVRIDTHDGERRGCSLHCKEAHFNYRRTSARFIVSGYRALIVLHTLSEELFEWDRKFSAPYHEAIQRMEEISTTRDGMKIAANMEKLGWELP